MKIDRRLTLLGVMLIVFSMTMATQYATTKIHVTYGIVHPSNADIRFIASDNSSADTKHVLRVTTNTSTNQFLTISLGDWAPATQKNYTAAFGIVNEEQFIVHITNISCNGSTAAGYIDIWLHGDRDVEASADSGVKVTDDGTTMHNANSVAWTLGAGNGAVNNSGYGEDVFDTEWDDDSDVQYSYNNVQDATNGTSDFVWVEICLDIPSNADIDPSATAMIFINFRAQGPNP